MNSLLFDKMGFRWRDLWAMPYVWLMQFAFGYGAFDWQPLVLFMFIWIWFNVRWEDIKNG